VEVTVRTPVSLRFTLLRLPLKATFRQASNTRTHGEAVWLEARRGDLRGYGEGCPRPYVTGETLESCSAWLDARLEGIMAACTSLEAMAGWADAHEAEIDASPSSWCAVECALLDLFARERGISVEALLGQPEPGGAHQYSAVLGNDEGWKTRFLLDQYLIQGLRDFKMKVAGDIEVDREKLDDLAAIAREHGHTQPPRVRLDANNLWHQRPDEALPYLRAIGRPFFALEEPVYPRDVERHSALSVALDRPIILDESLCTLADLERYDGAPGRFIANLKVSRVGGPRRALRLVEALRARGWPVIVGAHVGETSVLTRAALLVARSAGDALIAQEGAFGGRLVEREPCAPSLQWGAAGQLDLSQPVGVATAQGLTITPPEVWRQGWGLACRFPEPAPEPGERVVTEVMSDGYVIHARQWGADSEDVIVILHGGMSHSAWQRPLAAALSQKTGVTVVAPDRRGCGLNEGRGDLVSTRRTIDDVVEHLRLLAGRHRRIHLAGWCQGGQYAAVVARQLQRELPLASLLLITPGFFWNARFRSVIDATERVIQRLLDHFDSAPERLDAFVPIPLVPTDFTLDARWLDRIDADELKTTEVTLRSVIVMDEVQSASWACVPRVQLPTFVVFAEDDRIVDHRRALELFGAFWRSDPRNQVRTVPGPHALHLEQSAWLADQLADFMRPRD